MTPFGQPCYFVDSHTLCYNGLTSPHCRDNSLYKASLDFLLVGNSIRALLFCIFMTGQLSEGCRCPVQCQGWYRYPAGALASISSGAEIGLLSLRLRVSQGASLGDFLLAPPCPIEKVILWVGFLYLTSGSETRKPKPSTLSTKLSRQPMPGAPI